MKKFIYITARVATFISIFYTLYYFNFIYPLQAWGYYFDWILVLLSLLQIVFTPVLIRLFRGVWTYTNKKKRRRIREKFLITLIFFLIIGTTVLSIIDISWLLITQMRASVSEVSSLASFSSQSALISFGDIIIVILSIILLYLLWYLFFQWEQKRTVKKRFLLLFVLILWSGLMSNIYLYDISGPYITNLSLNPLIYNFNLFLESSQQQPHNSSKEDFTSYFSTWTSLGEKKNILLVFAESFESKYSKEAGWIYDYLPQFDKIAEDGMRFDAFHAPWCVSEQAHISFLEWIFPLPYNWKTASNQGYESYTWFVTPLAERLNTQWYHTSFLSSVSLWFLDQRWYLEQQWFQTIVGEEAFLEEPQYVFDAAPDKSLYDLTINTVKENLENDENFFIGIQTISTHTPRNTPYWTSEKSAREYADDTFAEFYEQLKETNFFEDGIMIVFWDHRVPTPINFSYDDILWPFWISKVLWFAVGSGITPKQRTNAVVQPIDLHFSLKTLISSWDVLVWNSYNDIFQNKLARDRWIFYCKYTNDEPLILTDKVNRLKELRWHEANHYIRDFQLYQLNHIEKSLLVSSGSYQEQNRSRSSLTYTGETFDSDEIDERLLDPSTSHPANSGADKQESAKEVSSSKIHKIEPTTNSRILVFGHAGAPRYAPSNSREWVLTAIEQWAQGVEIDLSFTRDGVNVVNHGKYPIANIKDETKLEVYKASGCYQWIPIEERDLDELQATCLLENWEKIYTLDEFFSLTKESVPFYFLEFKASDSAIWVKLKRDVDQLEDAMQIVRKHNLEDKVAFISYNEFIKEELAAQTEFTLGRDFYPWQAYPSEEQLENITYIFTPLEFLTGDHLDIIQSYNKPIITYTIQDQSQIVRVQELQDNNIPILGVLVDDVPEFLEWYFGYDFSILSKLVKKNSPWWMR